jgi:hypothetical protein
MDDEKILAARAHESDRPSFSARWLPSGPRARCTKMTYKAESLTYRPQFFAEPTNMVTVTEAAALSWL